MKYYWKDIEKPPGNWCGLYLRIETGDKPNFQVQVCKNERIKVVNQNKTLFWATTSKDYYNVLALKSYEKWEYDEMPIPPIRSDEVEIRKNLSDEQYFKEWSKFFINELIKGKSSFLYNGLWIINGFVIHDKTVWYYKSFKELPKGVYLDIYNVKESILREKLDWINWSHSDIRGLINIKEKPNENDGRVKWWRKKIKEGSIPPIFAMFLSCLQAHIIIDGHSRLMASILENVPPKIVLIYPAIEKNKKRDNYIREKVLKSFKSSEVNLEQMSQSSIDKRNNLLIEIHDENPDLEIKTKGFIIKSLETNWENEVIKELKSSNLLDEGEYMLKREY